MTRETGTVLEGSPSLHDIYEEVQAFSDNIRREEAYLAALERYGNDTRPSVDLYLRRGVRTAILAIDLLQILADPRRKELLLRELEEEAIPDRWIQEVVLGDTLYDPEHQDSCIVTSAVLAQGEEVTLLVGEEDPFGFRMLERLKIYDMQFFTRGIAQGDVDPVQEREVLLRAEIVGAGHDLIVDKYSDVLVSAGMTP